MNAPNTITLVRILMIPFFVAVYLVGNAALQIVATVIFMVAAFTDFLDGYIARKYNLVTNMGKFLDPIADKLLVASALFLLVEMRVGYAPYVAVFATIIMSRELIISAFRQVAASAGVVVAADKSGKIKTVCQDIALIIMLPAHAIQSLAGINNDIIVKIGFWILAVATVLTIYSGINYLVRNRKVLTSAG